MTDAQIIARARASLGVRAPVYLRQERMPKGKRAGYGGTDATGAHIIAIDRDLGGVARIYALAHEVVHAAQVERLGSYAAFHSAYVVAGGWSANMSATERETYRRNPYERDAQARGAEIAAQIAADLEGTT